MYGPSAHPPRKVATRPAQRIDSNPGMRRLDFVVVFIRYPPLLNFPFPISEPFPRLCLACCSLVNTRYSDFTVRFESDALIGRRRLVKSTEPFGLRRHIDALQSILHQ